MSLYVWEINILDFFCFILSSLDRALHSLGPKTGYVLPERHYPNPIDMFLLLCQQVKYRFHSNKSPGRLNKSFRVRAYLFQYLLQGSTPKFMILAIVRLIPNHIELIMLVSWIDHGRWLLWLKLQNMMDESL